MNRPENRPQESGFEGPLERRQELAHGHLIQLRLSAVQSVQLLGRVRGLILMLTAESGEVGHLSISIPSYLAEIYQMILTSFHHNSGDGIEVDVVDYLFVPFDIHFAKLIILSGKEGGIECWLSTFTIAEGEVTYYRLPPHLALLHAVVKRLPIESEAQLLGSAQETRFVDKTTLRTYILNSKGVLPSDADRKEVLEWARFQSLEELEELKKMVVDKEWYEWALWLSGVMGEERSEPGIDE